MKLKDIIGSMASKFAALALALICADSAWAADPVAKIGTTEYTTLADAFAAAQDGDAVQLIEDIEYSTTQGWNDKLVVNGKRVVFDLNGHNVTYTRSANPSGPMFYLQNGAELVIDGTGTIVLTPITTSHSVFPCVSMADNTGLKATLGENVTVYAECFGSVEYNTKNAETGSTFDIYGTIIGNNSSFINNLFSCSSGVTNFTVNVIGGTLEIPKYSDMHVNIQASTETIFNFNMASGKIYCTQANFNAVKFNLFAAVKSTFNITGGYFGSNAPTDGNNPARGFSLADGYGFYPVSGVDYCPYQVGVCEAKIGNVCYPSISAAIEAATASDFVTLNVDYSDVVTIPAGKTVNFNGGSYTFSGSFAVNGTLRIVGGTYTFNPADALLGPGCSVTDNGDGTWTVIQSVAQVGETAYSTFADALAAANALGTATIKFLADVDLGSSTINIASGKSITLDLNGNNVSCSGNDGFSVNSGATLVLCDTSDGQSGALTHKGSWDLSDNSGTIEILSGTYNVVNYGVAYNNGSAVLNIKGGTINSAKRAYYKGVTTISGGTINGTISDVKTTVITGGVFNNDPTAYVDTETYEVAVDTPSAGYWTVRAPQPVAQIGTTKYETLAEAIAAVPTTGAETTITMIADSAEPAVITVASGKNVVLDLNGKTVSYTTDAKSVYFLTNEGTLTIQDNSENADGQVLLTAQPDTGYSKETVTIYNCGGTLTLASGTIKNATAGGLAYAVNNSSNAWGSDVVSTFNMEGGTVSAPSGDAALRVYQNTGVGWKVQSKNYVNISGGTILDTGIFFDTYLYTVNQTLPADFAANDTAVGCDIDTVVNISGGTINGLIDMKIRHPYNTRLNITGGDFANCKMWVRKVSNEYGSGLASGTLSEPTESMVYISGGKFAFVAGKAFGLAYDCGTSSWTSYAKPYAVSGGVFNVEVPENACVAGKTSIANTETETKDAYPYTVGVAVAQIGATKYTTLAAAIADAQDGDTVKLLTDVTVSAFVDVSKSITLDGDGHQLTVNATRGIRVTTGDVDVTVKNLVMPKTAKMERAIQVDSGKEDVSLTIDNVTATATMYTVNVCADVVNLDLTIKDSNLTGWGVVNLWGDNGTVVIEDSTLTGVNDKSYNADGWNDFGVIIVEGDTTGETDTHASAYDITIKDTAIVANSTTGNKQMVLVYNNPSVNNGIVLENCTVELKNDNCSFMVDSGYESLTKLKDTTVYGTENIPDLPEGYCYVDDGEYKLVAKAVAQIVRGNTVVAKCGTLAAAVEAAESGDTVQLLTDVSATAVVEITKSIILDGNGHNLNTSATRAIWIDAGNVDVTVKNLTILANANLERAIQVNNNCNNVTLTIDTVTATATYYAINVCNGASNLGLTITNSTITGWSAVNAWGSNGNISIVDSELTGLNNKSYHQSNSFGVIVIEGDTTGQTDMAADTITVLVKNTTITSKSTTGNKQYVILYNNPNVNNAITLEGCAIVLDGDETSFFNDSGTGNTTKIKNTYLTGTETKPELPDYCEYVELEDDYFLISVNFEVYYYWAVSGGYSGVYTSLAEPFAAGWLVDGEYIALQKNVTLSSDIEYSTSSGTIAATGGSFTLTFGDYSITKGDYTFVIPKGVSIITDKRVTDLFDAPAWYYEIKETANGDGTYTYSIYIPEYTITYTGEAPDGVDGFNLPQATTYTNSLTSTILPLPTYTAAGTVFGGWKVNGEGDAISAIPAGTTGDVTLTATWISATTVDIVAVEAGDETEEKEASIKVTQEWIDANVTPAGSEATAKEIKDALNETAENGLKKWENYVLGLDGSDPNANVAADAAQGPVSATPITSNVDVPPVDTGFTVEYKLVSVDTNGTTVTQSALQPTPDLTADIAAMTSETNVVYYKTVAVITSTSDDSVKVEVPSTNTIGVLKVESGAKTTAIAVPWEALGGGDISVSNIVRTATLTPGDELMAYAPDGKYKAWELDENKVWQPVTVAGGSSETEADAYTVKRGSAVWLKRQDTTQPIYLVGEVAATEKAAATIEAGTAESPSWNLVGSAGTEPVNVNEIGAAATDKIIVPTATVPKNYEHNTEKGEWGYWDYETVIKLSGRKTVKKVWKSASVETIPAGTGFWYLNGGDSKDINL